MVMWLIVMVRENDRNIIFIRIFIHLQPLVKYCVRTLLSFSKLFVSIPKIACVFSVKNLLLV